MSIVQNNDVNGWIQSLYNDPTAFFDVPYAGRTLKFKKRFPVGITFAMQKKSQEEQLYEFIALLSSQPVFTVDQAKSLPQDFVMVFAIELAKYFNIEQIKKALPPTP